MDKQPVVIEWFARVMEETGELLIWLYDNKEEPHSEMVSDIVSLAVESKHLLDLHCNADFSPQMWRTYRAWLIDNYNSILKDGGLIQLNQKVMEEMSNDWQ